MKNKALEALGEVMDKIVPVQADVITPKITDLKEKESALKAINDSLNKKFDTTNSIIRLGDRVGISMPHIPTNLPSFDKKVLQIGGIPRGRVVEIFGPESSGKTTIALHVIAQEQKNGELVAFVDAEHALDPTWANTNGVDMDNLIVSQPDSGEQALEVVIELVKSGAVTLIVVDSVSALVPQAELDGDMGSSHMGLQARLMSQAMRKLVGICNKSGVTVIFINQIREKIGVMFGNPETTSGGRALKFYSSVRLDVRRKEVIKDGNDIIGHKMKIKAVKNKCGAPFKEAEIDLMYASGIDIEGNWLDYAIEQGVIEKSGSWFNFNSERLGQGRENIKNILRASPEVLQAVKEAMKKLNPSET